MKTILAEITLKDLLRAFNSQKEYIKITVHICNAGSCIAVKCTNKWEPELKGAWNGYDQFIDNDWDFHNRLGCEIKRRLNELYKSDNQDIKTLKILEGVLKDA